MEQGELQEFFDSLPASEQRRLLTAFAQMMEQPDPIQERDWSDKAGPGTLKGSPPAAMRTLSARNG